MVGPVFSVQTRHHPRLPSKERRAHLVAPEHHQPCIRGHTAVIVSASSANADGHYVAALCLNIDLLPFHNLQSVLGQFGKVDTEADSKESLNPAGADAIRARIDQFAARLATTPRSLKAEERKTLLRELKQARYFEIRRASWRFASHSLCRRKMKHAPSLRSSWNLRNPDQDPGVAVPRGSVAATFE